MIEICHKEKSLLFQLLREGVHLLLPFLLLALPLVRQDALLQQLREEVQSVRM